MIPVHRPAPDKGRISSKNDFELCYLRHQYLRKAKENPNIEEMTPYLYIVNNLSKNTFFTYYTLFKSVGLYLDDIQSIGQVHLISFLNLFALEKMELKMNDWILNWLLKHKGNSPKTEDFLQQNRANFSIFYKQRMEDLVRICKQKLRNIKGESSAEYACFVGISDIPKYPNKLIKEYETYGFKKLDFSIFKSIRKKANVKNNVSAFKFGDMWYVCFPVNQKSLNIRDLVNSEVNPYSNEHNMRPDQLYSDNEFKQFKKIFEDKPDDKKLLILKKFIAKNRNVRQYKSEVHTAKKLLKSIGQ